MTEPLTLTTCIQRIQSNDDNDHTIGVLDESLKEFEKKLLQLKKEERENKKATSTATLTTKLTKYDKSASKIMKKSIPVLKQKIERTLSDTKDIISDLLGKVKRGQVLEISLEYLELVRKSERISDQLRKLLEEEHCSVEILRLFDVLLEIRASPLALQPNFKRVLDARVSFLANRLVPKVRQRFNRETTKMGWPISTKKRENDSNIVLTKSFKEFFFYSVKIQARLHEHMIKISTTTSGDKLWAFHDLYQPLMKRFRFHFCSKSSKINRIDRPEWCFRYILQQIRAHREILTLKIEPLIREITKNNTSVESLLCSIQERDSLKALLNDYVNVLISHLRVVFPSILSLGKESKQEKEEEEFVDLATRPTTTHIQALLCKTVSEILEFNRTLRVEFKYNDGRSVNVLTSNNKWLEMWLEAELSLASSQLSSLLESSTAWHIMHEDTPTELSLGVCTFVCVCVCAIEPTFIYLINRYTPGKFLRASRSASGYVSTDSTLQRTRLTLTVLIWCCCSRGTRDVL